MVILIPFSYSVTNRGSDLLHDVLGIDEEVRVIKGLGAFLLSAFRPSFKNVVEGGVYLE